MRRRSCAGIGPRCASCQSISQRRRALACMPFRVFLPCCLLVCVRGNAGGASRQMQDMAGERGPEIGPMGTEHAGVGFGSTYDADEHRDRAGSPVRPLLHLVSYDCILDLVPTHSCGEDSSSSSQKPNRRVSPPQAFVPEGGQKGHSLTSRTALSCSSLLLLPRSATTSRALRADWILRAPALSPDTGGSGRVHREMQGGGGGREGGIPRRPVMVRVMPVRHVDGAAAPSSTRCRHRPNGYGLQRLADSESFSAFFLLSHQ